jgi:hypothetical protein
VIEDAAPHGYWAVRKAVYDYFRPKFDAAVKERLGPAYEDRTSRALAMLDRMISLGAES